MMEIELVNRGAVPREVEHLRVVVIVNGKGMFAGFVTPPPVGNRCELQLERASIQSAIEYTAASSPQGRALVDVVLHEGQLVGVVRPRLASVRRRAHKDSNAIASEAVATPRPTRR